MLAVIIISPLLALTVWIIHQFDKRLARWEAKMIEQGKVISAMEVARKSDLRFLDRRITRLRSRSLPSRAE